MPTKIETQPYQFNSTVTGLSSASFNSLTVGGTFAAVSLSSNGLKINGNSNLLGDLSIGGNLSVAGSATFVNTQSLVLTNSLVYLASANAFDLSDLGIVGFYTQAPKGYQTTGLVRNHNTNAWSLFSGVSGLSSASASVNWNDPGLTIDSLNANVSGKHYGDGSGLYNITGTVQPINNQTASYIIASTDVGYLITLNSMVAPTLSLPAINPVAGQSIDILQLGTGQVSLSAGLGVTLNGTPGLKLRTQYSAATLKAIGSNTWVLIGDLTP